MLGTIGASNVNSQIWKSLDMFFQRTSLPPPPPPPQGGFVVRAPSLPPTHFVFQLQLIFSFENFGLKGAV